MKKLLLVLALILSFSFKVFAYENVYPSYGRYESSIKITTSCDDLKGFKA